jgi:pilus assembly protein Flp/PilA
VRFIRNFCADARVWTAIEPGLILVLIVLAIFASPSRFAGHTVSMLTIVSTNSHWRAEQGHLKIRSGKLSFSKRVQPTSDYRGTPRAGESRVVYASDVGDRIMRNFFKNSKGATAIEYGLIAALIAVAAISAMSSIGGKLNSTFSNVSSRLV